MAFMPAFTTNAMTAFPIINFPWLSGDVPGLPSYDIYISKLVRFARCCTSVLDFHSNNLQITSTQLAHGYRYHKLLKDLESSKDNTPNFFRYLVIYCFKNMCEGESLTCYDDLVNKLRRVIPNFISSVSKIDKRLR